MKQILQNLSTGETSVEDIPAPKNLEGHVLIRSTNSLISPGTERALVDFGKSNLLGKALKQPEKVKQVLDKVKTDGVFTTLESVRTKLDQPLALGYSNSGVVIESEAEEFSPGDRVMSNGNHAEVVRVPKNLCCKIPEQVNDETASFAVLASIGLQGVRLINPTIGESVAVFGLGLVGLLVVQILKANGCRVIGIDLDENRCQLAKEFGAETINPSKGEDVIDSSNYFSRSQGMDAVIIAASAKGDNIVHQAASICRKRARVVLIGVVDLDLDREDFYEKEITFQVSSSYGPGRYDSSYEQKGQDYPLGFVRWTEKRNFEAVMEMMASGKLKVDKLITDRFTIDQGSKAYEALNNSKSLGIILEYHSKKYSILKDERKIFLKEKKSENKKPSKVSVGFIGGGNFASRTLIPAFSKTSSKLETLVTTSGISSFINAKKNDFNFASTDIEDILSNEKINTVVISTRHNLHATQVISCIEAGKNIYVEKPLALKLQELDEIEKAYSKSKASLNLIVGFNRRFSPFTTKIKSLISSSKEPKVFLMTINAGLIQNDHWTQDINEGGGRIVGEACHFIDLMRFLAGNRIVRHHSISMEEKNNFDNKYDKVIISLSFEDGSIGSIHYLANGGRSFPKERVEVFCGNRTLQLDNFRILKGFNWPGFKSKRTFSQDKGHFSCVRHFVDSIIEGKESPIPFDEIIESSRVSIEVAKSLSNNP